MRKILFRGKRKDNSKWTEGGIAFNGDRCFITCRERYKPDTRDFDTVDYYEKHPTYNIINIEVIPDTVGEHIGLTDKNGKQIFEGDIIKHYIKNSEFVKTYVVEWESRLSKFVGRYTGDEYYGEKYAYAELHEDLTYEVIGNIYDNSNLLKEGKENA